MRNARLLSITIENMKSFKAKTKIPFAPLTIIIGRNNSGKSTLIQTLLLLKQTLNDPREYIKLKLDGMVDAFSLRELTFGWPKEGKKIPGPILAVEWECQWKSEIKTSELRIHTLERDHSVHLSKLEFTIKSKNNHKNESYCFLPNGDSWFCEFNGFVLEGF